MARGSCDGQPRILPHRERLPNQHGLPRLASSTLISVTLCIRPLRALNGWRRWRWARRLAPRRAVQGLQGPRFAVVISDDGSAVLSSFAAALHPHTRNLPKHPASTLTRARHPFAWVSRRRRSAYQQPACACSDRHKATPPLPPSLRPRSRRRSLKSPPCLLPPKKANPSPLIGHAARFIGPLRLCRPRHKQACLASAAVSPTPPRVTASLVVTCIGCLTSYVMPVDHPLGAFLRALLCPRFSITAHRQLDPHT